MNMQKINLVYFSAAGTTEKAVTLFAEGSGLPAEKINITDLKDSYNTEFGPDELVVFGVPSFAGRVPGPAAERFSQMKGNNTPIVLLVNYGYREYDDTLIEMKDMAEAQGFIPVAAAALLAEHSLIPGICTGRPDEKDAQEIRVFAEKVMEKLAEVKAVQDLPELTVKGKRPYKTVGSSSIRPAANENCVSCGFCAKKCPMGAIPKENPGSAGDDKCIACMRCVAVCPKKARSVKPEMVAFLNERIAKALEVEKSNEFVL